MILSFVERLERLEEEIKGLNDDKKDIFAEAKGNGFDTKVIKRLLAYRRRKQEEIEEEDSIFELYLEAIRNAEAARSAPASRARTGEREAALANDPFGGG